MSSTTYVSMDIGQTKLGRQRQTGIECKVVMQGSIVWVDADCACWSRKDLKVKWMSDLETSEALTWNFLHLRGIAKSSGVILLYFLAFFNCEIFSPFFSKWWSPLCFFKPMVIKPAGESFSSRRNWSACVQSAPFPLFPISVNSHHLRCG